MFGALMRRLKSSAAELVDDYIERAAVAGLFLIAAGFLVAAVTVGIIRLTGPVAGCLIMAVLFVIAGSLALLALKEEQRAEEEEQRQESESPALPALSGEDNELILAAVRAAAPVLVSEGGKMLFRNLPLLGAAAAGLFVMLRAAPGNGARAGGRPEAAE